MRRSERIARIVLLTFAVASFGVHFASASTPPPDRPPTVGDSIKLHFDLAPDESIRLEQSDRWELVSRLGGDVVVRSFEPGTFAVLATIRGPEGERTDKREVTVASVLHENDDLKPAALEPPWPLPDNHAATIAIVLAALAAAVSWGFLFYRAKRAGAASRGAEPVIVPEDFRSALARVRRLPPGDERLIALADITRTYLGAIEPPVGRELTTTEVSDALGSRTVPGAIREIVREILDEGDFAKFSEWGGRPERFDDLAGKAVRVVEVAGVGGGRR